MRALVALIRKDLQLFASDRRALIMSFVAPIAIASFFGAIFPGGGGSSEPARVPVAIVDQDGSAIARGIVNGASTDAALAMSAMDADAARAAVRTGTLSVAVVIPAGFGDAAGRAFLSGSGKPSLTMLYDPSRSAELALVRGVMTQHVMQAVSAEMFGGAQGQKLVDETLASLESTALPSQQQTMLRDLLQSARRFYGGSADGGGSAVPGAGAAGHATGGAAAGGDAPGSPGGTAAGAGVSGNTGASGNAGGGSAAPRGLGMPYEVAAQAVTSGDRVAYNGYAHAFAGMGVQFLFFAAVDLGIGILLERQRGIWKRLRSAPLSKATLLGGRALSGAIIALLTLFVSFGFAMVVFGVRIEGSQAGFVLVAAATAVMASAFGLLIAAVGKTPGGTRGVAILAVLLMVMLGGAWVPSFIFPAWLQQVTVAVPARWAIDGLDAMTWRGLGFAAAVAPSAVMLGFAGLFAGLAWLRFQWEEA